MKFHLFLPFFKWLLENFQLYVWLTLYFYWTTQTSRLTKHPDFMGQKSLSPWEVR